MKIVSVIITIINDFAGIVIASKDFLFSCNFIILVNLMFIQQIMSYLINAILEKVSLKRKSTAQTEKENHPNRKRLAQTNKNQSKQKIKKAISPNRKKEGKLIQRKKYIYISEHM